MWLRLWNSVIVRLIIKELHARIAHLVISGLILVHTAVFVSHVNVIYKFSISKMCILIIYLFFYNKAMDTVTLVTQ